MKKIHIDIETYSDVNLAKSGVYRYCQSPEFQILLFAYAVDEEPTKVVDIAAGEKIQISGFGTFEVRERAERSGRNPKTGEIVKVPACKYLAFVAAKAVKEKLN